MATIINTGAGSIPPVLLASLTNVPTSSTEVSGTENWKKFDAIYFECFMNYGNTSDNAILTNLILTNNISIGAIYQPLRISGSDGASKQMNIRCIFSENVISISTSIYGYHVTKLNVYGVNF